MFSKGKAADDQNRDSSRHERRIEQAVGQA
jgi:hypothetical protein